MLALSFAASVHDLHRIASLFAAALRLARVRDDNNCTDQQLGHQLTAVLTSAMALFIAYHFYN